jgi:glycosyltransferase involved in cell wall biosynthesis
MLKGEDLGVTQSVAVSVVVPFMNERECLGALLDSLREELSRFATTFEIILVDDGSTDGSWLTISSGKFADLPLVGIRFSRNFGKEAAIRAGLARSRGLVTFVMDADLQHPPSLLPEMHRAWRDEGVLVVEAVKKGKIERTMIGTFGAWIVHRVLSKVTGVSLEGATDFKLLDRKVVDEIVRLPERISLFRGIVSWFGLPSKQVEFEVQDRFAGSTRWSLLRLMSLAIDAITGFTTIPLRIETFFSFIFILVSFALILQTIYNFLMGNAVEGFTTVIICILLVGGVITAGLGIIGEYLARVYDEVKARPSYIVREVYTHGGAGQMQQDGRTD